MASLFLRPSKRHAMASLSPPLSLSIYTCMHHSLSSLLSARPPRPCRLFLCYLATPTFMGNSPVVYLVLLILVASWQQGHAQQCGSQAGGAVCANGLCCSRWGWCGITYNYCGPGCQSQCPSRFLSPLPTPSGGILSRDVFEIMLPNRNNTAYTYDAFIAAANAFPGFSTTGDDSTRKRELAAFFAQSSLETNGRAASGPFTSGYSYKEEVQKSQLCSNCCPCPSGRQYYARGPLHLSWNFNYLACGNAIGVDLLNNPDLVASDPTISFKTALWRWMTPQNPKPSCHDAMVGIWRPSGADKAANRRPGFGMTTNIINGRLECGSTQNNSDLEQNRVGYYRQYCSILGVHPGQNVDCLNMRPYGLPDEEIWGGVGVE